MVGKSIRHQVAECRAAAEQFAAPRNSLTLMVSTRIRVRSFIPMGAVWRAIQNKTTNFYVCID
jgi:hypothetical protein